MGYTLKTKRAYDAPEAYDGERILVDRLWPRGIKKENLKADRWLKDVAPSNELRRWFGHEPERFALFTERYQAELDANATARELAEHCREQLPHSNITLLYGAKDPAHNQAVVLKAWIERQIEG